MAAAKPKSKLLKGQVNGGQWTFDIVFETKDGQVLEGTRARAVYSESQMKGDMPAENVGTLLRWRTRELLSREGL